MSTSPVYSDALTSCLLVWRECAARQGAIAALRDIGFATIDVAEDAVRAFALLSQGAPRLVLVDANLRPTSGLVFVRELRATTVPSRDAPLILASTRPNDTLCADARRAGADGVVFGQVTPAALQFWLTCTASDARVVIECKDYRGPDRRAAAPSCPAVGHERRRFTPSAQALAAAAQDPIVQRLVAACVQTEKWGETGDLVPLDIAVAAVVEAAALARTQAEESLTRGLDAALLRLHREAHSWDVDPAGIVGALAALKDMATRRFTAQTSGMAQASLQEAR